MSHDRGCHCGREKWDYADCPFDNCFRRPRPGLPGSMPAMIVKDQGQRPGARLTKWCCCAEPQVELFGAGDKCKKCGGPIREKKGKRMTATGQKASDRQVGGDHYHQTSRQHWDLVADFYGADTFVCNATKYLVRWRKKDGLKDLEKALHYVEKMAELAAARPDFRPTGKVPVGDLVEYFDANEVGETERSVMTRVFNWPEEGVTANLFLARDMLLALVEGVRYGGGPALVLPDLISPVKMPGDVELQPNAD